MTLPNFIVIGAPKCGTTSIYHYLRQHPEIYLPKQKELHYFSYDLLKENVNGPGDATTLAALCRDKKNYEMFYAGANEKKAIGEVSPSYLYFSEVSERIRSDLGRIKIVAMLRNPIDKAYSQYMHLVRENLETLGFRDALKEEKARTVAGWSDIWRFTESSMYTERLKKYISVFGRENVRIIIFDDFASDPMKIMRGLFEFLGVDKGFMCDTSKAFNRTGRPKSKLVADFFARPNLIKSVAKKMIPQSVRISVRQAVLDVNTGEKDQLDASMRKYLASYFKDDIAGLEELLSRKLDWLG